MAEKKTAASNVAILRALNKEGVFATDNRIPDKISDDISGIAKRIMEYSPTRNAFMDALWGLMIQGNIHSTIFKSPLGILKKEPMRYGAVEQEIFVNMIKGYAFDDMAGVNQLYGYYENQVMSAYHTITPAIQYAMTLTFENLRTAFSSEYGIRDLIQAKTQAMFSSAQYDEYLNSRSLIETAYANGNVYTVSINDVTTKEEAEDLTIMMKKYIGMMKFPQPSYNLAGATSSSFDGGIYYMTTPEYDSVLDVKVLATAFHDSKVSLDAQKIIVDKFNNPAIKAVLFDIRWFKIRDNFEVVSDSRNGAALTWNYFLTNSEMFSYSPFFTMIVFTTEPQEISEITTVDNSLTVSKDMVVAIPYKVESSDGTYAYQAVDFTISGNTSSHTFMIPGTNNLKIGKDETSNAITVTISSRIAPEITASTVVTVS